jgi:hypothetical protein
VACGPPESAQDFDTFFAGRTLTVGFPPGLGGLASRVRSLIDSAATCAVDPCLDRTLTREKSQRDQRRSRRELFPRPQQGPANHPISLSLPSRRTVTSRRSFDRQSCFPIASKTRREIAGKTEDRSCGCHSGVHLMPREISDPALYCSPHSPTLSITDSPESARNRRRRSRHGGRRRARPCPVNRKPPK